MRFLIPILFLTGCAVTEPQEQTVEYVEGYEEFCLNEPLSPLCAPRDRIKWYLHKES